MNAPLSNQWAVRAMVLMALEKHAGEWCTLGWLKAHAHAPLLEVTRACSELQDAHPEVRARMVDGMLLVGMYTTDKSPVRSTVPSGQACDLRLPHGQHMPHTQHTGALV